MKKSFLAAVLVAGAVTMGIAQFSTERENLVMTKTNSPAGFYLQDTTKPGQDTTKPGQDTTKPRQDSLPAKPDSTSIKS